MMIKQCLNCKFYDTCEFQKKYDMQNNSTPYCNFYSKNEIVEQIKSTKLTTLIDSSYNIPEEVEQIKKIDSEMCSIPQTMAQSTFCNDDSMSNLCKSMSKCNDITIEKDAGYIERRIYRLIETVEKEKGWFTIDSILKALKSILDKEE
jgi:hypothetical protein